jgi:transposase
LIQTSGYTCREIAEATNLNIRTVYLIRQRLRQPFERQEMRYRISAQAEEIAALKMRVERLEQQTKWLIASRLHQDVSRETKFRLPPARA